MWHVIFPNIKVNPPGGGGSNDRLLRFRVIFGFWYRFEPETSSSKELETSRNRKGNEHLREGFENRIYEYFSARCFAIFLPRR